MAWRRPNPDDAPSGSLKGERTVTWLPAQETMNTHRDMSIMTKRKERDSLRRDQSV